MADVIQGEGNCCKNTSIWETAGGSEAYRQEVHVQLSVLCFCWQTNYKAAHNILAVYAFLTEHPMTRWHHIFFSPLVLLLLIVVILQNKPLPDPKIHPSSPPLIKYTPSPHKYNGQKHSSHVPSVHTDTHAGEISGALGAVGATRRAVAVKSFGMVKVQCTHAVAAAGETQRLK